MFTNTECGLSFLFVSLEFADSEKSSSLDVLWRASGTSPFGISNCSSLSGDIVCEYSWLEGLPFLGADTMVQSSKL
jgi:hypothetical protein